MTPLPEDARLPPGVKAPRSATVRVLPDGKVATRVRFSVRRVGHRWSICGISYNPLMGRFTWFKHVVLMPRVRTKSYALRLVSQHFRPYWNWYLATPDQVRRTAKESGVRVRLVEYKENDK